VWYYSLIIGLGRVALVIENFRLSLLQRGQEEQRILLEIPLHHKRGPRESGGKRPHRRYVLNGTDTIDLRVRKLFPSRQYSLTYPAKRGSGPEDL
jgi:hypothetical protein